MSKKYKIRLGLDKPFTSLFSIPQSSHYQWISNLRINALNYLIVEEKKWGNKILIIDKSDNIKIIKNRKIFISRFFENQKQKNFMSFTLKPTFLKSSINPEFTLKSYKKTNIPRIYLTPNRFINGKDPKIKSLSKKLINQEKNLYQVIKKLYDFVLSYLTYGQPTDGLYPYHQALNEKITDCGGFSTLLASFYQSINIPSRLVVGFLIKKSVIKEVLNKFLFISYNFQDFLIHAWLEILLPDGRWFPADPSINWRRKKGLTKRQGGFGYIPDDRLVTSFGCDFELKINRKNYKIDLLQKVNLIKTKNDLIKKRNFN